MPCAFKYLISRAQLGIAAGHPAGIAAGHAFLGILLGTELQRPSEESGDELLCCSMVVHS